MIAFTFVMSLLYFLGFAIDTLLQKPMSEGMHTLVTPFGKLHLMAVDTVAFFTGFFGLIAGVISLYLSADSWLASIFMIAASIGGIVVILKKHFFYKLLMLRLRVEGDTQVSESV